MRWLVFLSVLSVVLVAGCEEFFFVDEEIEEIVDKGDPSLCADLTDDTPARTKARQDRCYEKVGVKIGDPSACAKIEKDYRHDNCMSQIAVNTKNERLCDSLRDDKTKCIADVAVEKGSILLCAKAGDHLNDCVAGVATKKKDETLCEELPEGERDDCYLSVSRVKPEMGVCMKITKQNRGDCIADISEHFTDDYRCTFIPKENIDARDRCHYNVGRKTADMKTCNKIQGSLKNTCIQEVAAELGNDYYCTGISPKDVGARDRCYYNVNKKNPSMDTCNEIKGTLKNLCIQEAAAGKGNDYYCTFIKGDQDLREECFIEVVKKTGNMGSCKHVSESRKPLCWEEAAVAKQEDYYCTRIKDPEARKRCEERVAQAKGESGGDGVVDSLKEKAGDTLGSLLGKLLED